MFNAGQFLRWASGIDESAQVHAPRPTEQIAGQDVISDGTPHAASAQRSRWSDAASPTSISATIDAAAHTVGVPDQRKAIWGLGQSPS